MTVCVSFLPSSNSVCPKAALYIPVCDGEPSGRGDGLVIPTHRFNAPAVLGAPRGAGSVLLAGGIYAARSLIDTANGTYSGTMRSTPHWGVPQRPNRPNTHLRYYLWD